MNAEMPSPHTRGYACTRVPSLAHVLAHAHFYIFAYTYAPKHTLTHKYAHKHASPNRRYY